MNKEILIERRITLCEERDINLTTAFVESGVGKNFRSNLKNSNPSDKNLNLLAKYFNVSVEYLLGEESEDDLAMTAFYQVRAWLEDNGYDIRVSEYDLYTIDKDGQQTNLFFEDLLAMSGDIKKRSEQGFELAMLEWERKLSPRRLMSPSQTRRRTYLRNSETPRGMRRLKSIKRF